MYGQTVTLTAAVAPGSATGNVTFYDGATFLGVAPVASGNAVFRTIGLPPGSHSLRARYDGAPTFAPSTSASVAEAVNAKPGGTFTVGVAPIAANHPPLAVADLNGDGKADLLTNGGPSNDGFTNGLYVYFGNGDGTFQSPTEYLSTYFVISAHVADLNNDGKPDVAVSVSGAVLVLLGNGDGTFQSAIPVNSDPDLSALGVGDFNEDGLADLALSDYATGQINLYMGNGDGTFQPASQVYSLGTILLHHR